jgi:hypothetical protein
MPLKFALVAFALTFLSFLGWIVCQKLIVRRLNELNGGKLSPLISEDGINVNEHNSRFSKFLKDISGETDKKLKILKKMNLLFWRLGLILFFCSLVIAIQVA